MDLKNIRPDPCDYQLIQFSNCLQCLSCICSIAALVEPQQPDAPFQRVGRDIAVHNALCSGEGYAAQGSGNRRSMEYGPVAASTRVGRQHGSAQQQRTAARPER